MQIIRTDNPEQEVINLLEEKLQTYKNQPILLLLSGGSWLSIYDKVRVNDFDKRFTVGMLDERFSQDEKINNFAQFKQTKMYQEALQKGVGFIDTEVQVTETLADLAIRFERSLRLWRAQNPNGIIVATMGMGTDGHVAGIFSTLDTATIPEDNWVVGYEVSESVNEFTKRVTVTPYFLTHEVQQTICYVIGKDKCAVLEQVLSEAETTINYPVKIWQEMKDVILFTNCNT